MSSSRPNPSQVQLAAALSLDISQDTESVAAARLLDAVAGALCHEAATPSTERQRSYASSLGIEVVGDSKRVASAKIAEHLHERNLQAIRALDLKPGDTVTHVTTYDYDGATKTHERIVVVSSINPSGRIYFKGGNGYSAWPTELRKAPPN